jgi:hypothetical protein
MKIVDLIYSTGTILSTSKYGAYAYLTILKNGEQQIALAGHFLKIILYLQARHRNVYPVKILQTSTRSKKCGNWHQKKKRQTI